MACLCKGQASLIVHFEDFLDCIDVGSCSQVQTQVILHGSTHDLLKQKRLCVTSAHFSIGTTLDLLRGSKL